MSDHTDSYNKPDYAIKEHAKEKIRVFWNKLGNYKFESPQNRYNMLNLLTGYLQCLEDLGYLTHDEVQDLFEELDTGLDISITYPKDSFE